MWMKILLCTDGSRSGLSAVRLGGTVAARLEAEVTLLCVVESKRRDPIRSLERATRVMEKSGATFTPFGRRGRLLEEMLGEMLHIEYDLVIVGYYARSFLQKMLLGSLAARIANELPVSVLIVRGQRDWINHVLIGISGGGFTEECSKWGGRIAAAFEARATLLHVSAAPPLMYTGLEEVVETLTEFLQTDTPDADAIRQAVAFLTEMGVQANVELTRGLPERELLRVAHQRDVDLLVIGSAWAAQPVRRIFLRNITEKVLLNTQRPVLVVRPVV
jgi:nucleotide-binding universal stress UspA family protein